MDNGGGGCCIARYGGTAGGGAGGGYDISTIDRIMRKFRPIAPKPAQAGPSSSPEMSETSGSSGKGRRRSNGNINRRCNNGNNNRKRKALTATGAAVVVTLPLLPETPDRKNIIPTKESSAAGTAKKLPIWLSFGSKEELMLLDRTVAAGTPEVMTMMETVVISSCVTVECVTDTWVDVDGLGCTDGERRMNLERDRCPGFMSDGFGRVTWTNDAYRKMVMEDGKGEVVVRLAVKDTAAVTAALASNTAAFTCRVRVQNRRSTCGNYGKEIKSSITLPCDVWRMDGGGFLWRLDVTAALSLGR